MNSKKKMFVMLGLVLMFVLLLGGAYVLYEKLGQDAAPNQLAAQETASATEQDGQDAEQELSLVPDFTVYDKEGNAVRLYDFIGKPIVLNFWASWCGPCKSEMPEFHDKYLELEGDVQFLMINSTDGSRETVETAAAYIEDQGYTFPVFYDTDHDANATYGIYSLPTTFFIDAKGHGVAYAKGAIDGEALQMGIDMITE